MNADDPSRTTADPSLSGALGRRPGSAVLHIVHPIELRATLGLREKPVVLGRHPEDPAVPALAHKLVSRRHLLIEWDAASHCHVATDLASQNGTLLDGAELPPRACLHPGSVIRAGAVVMVYDALAGAPLPDASDVALEALPGDSFAMRRLRLQVAHVAPDPSAVLITGPTGTGKEFVAREIHHASGRKGKLVSVNCAALSPQLVESELFGHVRGAFSGAQREHAGLFLAADGGTLLLDEIGELALELQAKLLRVLQDGRVRPVGSTLDQAVDVRVVAATHRDVTQMVEAGTFRRDLLARLSPWELAVPPLCERRCDILPWLERLHAHWLAERGRCAAAPLRELKADAVEALLLLDWTDNLRGLQRLVHTLATAPGAAALKASELPPWLSRAPAARVAESSTLHVQQPIPERPASPSRSELIAALGIHGGSVRATARYFQRERRQIYRWMDGFGLRNKA